MTRIEKYVDEVSGIEWEEERTNKWDELEAQLANAQEAIKTAQDQMIQLSEKLKIAEAALRGVVYAPAFPDIVALRKIAREALARIRGNST